MMAKSLVCCRFTLCSVTPEQKFGWFVEPTYSYSFSNGHEQALGMAVGLLIPIR
jgi:hypothetical protein